MQIHTLPALYTTALIVTASTIAVPVSGQTPESTPRSPSHLVAPQESGYASRTSEGEVTFDVQPRWEDGALFVDVEANTHSVPLESLDLAAQVRLVIGTDSFAPDEAGELSGHHGNATLEFRLESRPEEFTIEIRDVPDVPIRTLTWPVAETTQAENADSPRSPRFGR
ncbi:MAG: hypothetical protein ACC682_14725 [Gemmatimonadota bacterium]